MPKTLPLREFLAFIVPGFALLGVLVFAELLDVEAFKDDIVKATILLVVGSYLLGFVCHHLGGIILWISKKAKADPYKTTRQSLPEHYKAALVRRLKSYWGDELHTETSNELFLCWRDVQRSDHSAIPFLLDLVSRFNFARSLLFPAIALAVCAGWKKDWYVLGLGALFFVAAVHSYYYYKDKFAVNVYRTWFVIKRSEDDATE